MSFLDQYLVPMVSSRWQFGIKNLLRLRQPWDDHFNIGWQLDMFSQALKVLMPISHVIKHQELLFLEAVLHLCTVFFVISGVACLRQKLIKDSRT